MPNVNGFLSYQSSAIRQPRASSTLRFLALLENSVLLGSGTGNLRLPASGGHTSSCTIISIGCEGIPVGEQLTTAIVDAVTADKFDVVGSSSGIFHGVGLFISKYARV
jgi:hypothetical protein